MQELKKNMHQLIHHHYKDGRPYPVEKCHIFTTFQQNKGTTIDNEVLWRKDGVAFPAEYSSFPIIDNEKCSGAVVSFTDITKRKQAEEELRLASTVYENVNEGLMVTDRDGNIISVNNAFTMITGYTEQEVTGENPRILRSGKHNQFFYEKMWICLIDTGYWQGEIWNRKKDGVIFPEWQSISSVKDDEGRTTHYVSAFSDISSLKETEQRLQYLAHHGPLTNLPNRLLFKARFELSLQNAARKKL